MLACSAGTIADPIGLMPSTSKAIAIVFAVNWPPQAPAPGLATDSSSARSSSLIVPAAWAPTASKTSWIVTSLPRKLPGAIEPPYSITPGRFSRASAITVPGIVLSQALRATIPSNRWPSATSSIESAMTSRDTRLVFIPLVPIVMPSEIAIVLSSIGVPPASRIPCLTFAASARRWKLQGIVSIHVEATPMIGLLSASASKPMPCR